MHVSFIATISTLALALSAALPGQAQAQATQAELYIDVATHAMPGMPGMGAIGRLAGTMGGERASYGMARHPGMPGKYLDVALHNHRQPGAPAEQAVPGHLGLGDRIALLAPVRRTTDSNSEGSGVPGSPQDGSFRIRYYWGCGDQVRAGQPVEFTTTIRNGKPVTSGRTMPARQVPSRGIAPAPQYALWPNPTARKAVGPKASLVGAHQLDGVALPASMRFELERDHDFLPELTLASEGDAVTGMTLRWEQVDGARAYFAHATAMHGDTMVMWSSSEDAYAGPELFDYLPDALLTQWTGKRTVMPAGTRECRIPQGVFADSGQAGAMVQMIAYGQERSLAEPRPADAPRGWQPAWTVRVRNKSTAMLMPGMGAAGTDAVRESAKPTARDAAKSMLRGLLRN